MRLFTQVFLGCQVKLDLDLPIGADINPFDQLSQDHIDDCYDGFLTWYFPECGRSGPDMDKIKETCPIDLNSIREPGYLEKSLSAIALKKKDP